MTEEDKSLVEVAEYANSEFVYKEIHKGTLRETRYYKNKEQAQDLKPSVQQFFLDVTNLRVSESLNEIDTAILGLATVDDRNIICVELDSKGKSKHIREVSFSFSLYKADDPFFQILCEEVNLEQQSPQSFISCFQNEEVELVQFSFYLPKDKFEVLVSKVSKIRSETNVRISCLASLYGMGLIVKERSYPAWFNNMSLNTVII